MSGRIQQVAANITAAVAGAVFAGAVTPWIRLDAYTVPFNVSLLVSQDGAGGNTLAIDYVVDDMSNGRNHQVLVNQTTTTITVTDNGFPWTYGAGLGHGLAVGDMVVLQGTQAGVDGVYSVATVPSASTYTLTTTVSQTLVNVQCNANTGKALTAGGTGDKIIGASGAGITVRTALPVNAPVTAVRLRCTTFAAGAVARLVAIEGGLAA
jgi:hypothetical protein